MEGAKKESEQISPHWPLASRAPWLDFTLDALKYMHACIHTYEYEYVCMHIVYTQNCICIHRYTYVCIHIYMYIYIYAYIHLYMYIMILPGVLFVSTAVDSRELYFL